MDCIPGSINSIGHFVFNEKRFCFLKFSDNYLHTTITLLLIMSSSSGHAFVQRWEWVGEGDGIFKQNRGEQKVELLGLKERSILLF